MIRLTRFFSALLILLPVAGMTATFTVLNTSDSGAGSLRQAIMDANNTDGPDLISFQIPGTKPFTITPLGPLPSITDPVTIDGTTQAGFTGQPIIQLNGASAGTNANGLLILGGNGPVRGLVINRFEFSGIRIEGFGTNVIQGNYLGTDVNGTNNAGNGEGGIYIYQSPGNLVGGTDASARNLLSGSNLAGIFIQNTSSTDNKVQGNYIGTDITGTKRLGNWSNGVVIASAPRNVVGGTTAAERNIISGNNLSGVYLLDSGATANSIAGNYIGTDVSGTAVLSNAFDGVTLNGADNNVIGGTSAGLRNIISGNGHYGVLITNSAIGNQIQGNYIGTAASGSGNFGNEWSGVGIIDAALNTIGGTSPSARNVISANKDSGVFIEGSGAVANIVRGNFIGTDASGGNALGNTLNGVLISDLARNNTIGGTTAGAGNVLSANLQSGVYLVGDGVTGNVIQGNLIGTDASGHADLGNALSGVRVESSTNTIGGASAARNVISGNGNNGIYLYSADANNNVIQGNFIGTDITGTAAVPNSFAGIGITSAPGNIIGGVGVGNVISGNILMGIYVEGGASGNVFQGNFIGTDVTGTSALGNGSGLSLDDGGAGIDIFGSPSNLIGGTAAGAGNLISANLRDAIFIQDAGAAGNIIQGNFIGTAIDGVSPLGNAWHGIELGDTGGATGTVIGGTQSGAGNRIAFASEDGNDGVRIRTATGNTGILIRGNSFFSNGGGTGLGIDLGTDGVTANDSCDGDSGANRLQNYPTLVSASSGGQTTIQGSLNSTANTTFLLQFYSSPACDASGFGEGQTYLGDGMVTTAANCNGNFTVTLPNAVPGGSVITATATDPANNTSEFSACVTVPASSGPPLTIARSGNSITLCWPAASQGFVAQQATNLTPPIAWAPVTNSPSQVGDRYVITVTPGNAKAFYRLIFQ